MNMNVTLGEVTAEPGTKKQGFWKVAERASTPIRIPLFLINGSGPGPRLWIHGSVHGDEYEGPQTIVRLGRQLDPKAINGLVIAIPVLNTTAFESYRRTSPVDNLDLNRVFPGNPDGFLTEQIAYNVFNTIKANADFLIDLHSGGGDLFHRPLSLYTTVGNAENDAKAKEMAEYFGVGQLVLGTRGHFLKGTISVEVSKVGVPCMAAEAGGEGRLNTELVEAEYNGLLNVMKYLKMIAGNPVHPKGLSYASDTIYVRCKHAGFFHILVKNDQKVKSGDPLARITDLFGEEIETVQAPSDGIVVAVRTIPAVTTGDLVAFICPPL